MNLKEIAKKHALKNAFDYGRADAGAVVGKVMAEFPDAKKEMKKTMEAIRAAVAEVNKMKGEAVEKEVKKYEFAEKKHEEGEHKLKLEGAVHGKVVTRFLPEPNGPAHIGHAKAALLSYEAANQYGGKCILRWDDTNPETEEQEYVDAIRSDLRWLGLEFFSEGFNSDKMPKFYEYAEKLVERGDAYVCTCAKKKINEDREKGIACACRDRNSEENDSFWKKMLDKKIAKGEAILRLKADMQSLNTVMRDPTLFRVITASHYRQGKKYVVWPTYDFEASISDSLEGVTHALRSKEYELRDELYYYILDRLALRKPVVYDFSRLNIRGTVLSKRFLKPLIEKKLVSGWDDPRLPTLAGLRRRGILPEAIKNFVLSFGLSKVESEPTWDALLSENRKLVDGIAERYFFVKEPVKLKVAEIRRQDVRMPKHPSQDLGERILRVDGNYLIPRQDVEEMWAGETIALKQHAFVKIVKKGKELEGKKVELEEVPKKIVQWVPEKDGMKATVLVPGDLFVNEKFNPESLREEKGVCERNCAQLKEGQVIQFERYGFVALDKKKKNSLEFVWSC
jgi:glutamyl-tRNA synthetase